MQKSKVRQLGNAESSVGSGLSELGDQGASRVASVRDLLFRGGVILLAVLWIYSPTYHGDWLWDDDSILTANPVVQSASLEGLYNLWVSPTGADYFPLSYTALWAQWPFFGLNSTGYHVVTILLHATGALLLWRLLVVMRIPGAWLAGLLFAIHPVCVESVAWVSEIKNTISLPLFLLAGIFFVRHDDAVWGDGSEAAGRTGSRDWVLSVVCFALAMLAKTSVVMFPVVLLLHAWWKRGGIAKRDLVAAAPFFLVSLVLGLVTIYYQHGRAIGEEKMPVADLFTVVGFLSRTATAGMAIMFYLWESIFPFRLLPIYPQWQVNPPQLAQFLPWPILVAAGCGLWSCRGTAAAPTLARHAIFGLGFFLLMVFPILGFITISYMRITWVADHFNYVAIIGIIVPLCAAAAAWFASARPPVQLAALAAATVLLAGLAVSSLRYAHVFANEDNLWTYTLESNPDAWQAHNRLGARKAGRGDVEGALYHFTNSTRLRPDLGETHNNLATTYMALGRTDEALEEFKVTTELLPNVFAVQLNRGNALTTAGRNEQAEKWYQDLVTRFPDQFQAWNNLGIIQVNKGNRMEGIVALRRAVEIAPNLEEPRRNLDSALRTEAEALAVAGQFAEAEAIYREMLKASPGDVMLLTNHGVVLYKLGRNDAAITAFRRALAINPGAKEAAESLAVALGNATPAQPPLETEEPLPSTLSPAIEAR